MEDKDILIHEVLDDAELAQASGGLMDCANAPKENCPKCAIKAFSSPAKVIKGDVKVVPMNCYAWYSSYATGETGYCYRCPECGYEMRKPVTE